MNERFYISYARVFSSLTSRLIYCYDEKYSEEKLQSLTLKRVRSLGITEIHDMNTKFKHYIF